MKKELFKIFKDFTLEDVPESAKTELINILNTEGTDFNSFLVLNLRILTEAVEKLEKGSSLLAISTIDYILGLDYTAKSVVLLIENERRLIKSDVATVGSILINAKSVINSVNNIRELQAENIKKLTPEEMLVVLTT